MALMRNSYSVFGRETIKVGNNNDITDYEDHNTHVRRLMFADLVNLSDIRYRGAFRNRSTMNKTTLKKHSGYSVSCIEQIPDSCTGIVIAVHGFSSSKECSTYQVLLRKLPRAGLGLIGIDLPGHGKGESYAETLRIEACKESIAAAEKYICNAYPTIPVYYFGSSFGAYIIGLYLSTREHTGRKAFFRSAAVNMPDLFIKQNPSEEEQEKLRQLNEEGFFYYSLDDGGGQRSRHSGRPPGR